MEQDLIDIKKETQSFFISNTIDESLKTQNDYPNNKKNDRCLPPVCISQLRKFSNQYLKDLFVVCIVASVRIVKGFGETCIRLTLDDHTGLLDCVYYNGDAKIYHTFQPNHYVRVFGTYHEKQPLRIHHAEELKTLNELTHHYLIVAHSHKFLQSRSIKKKELDDNKRKSIKKNMKDPKKLLNNTYTQVVRKILQECDDSEQGLHIDAIIKQFLELQPEQKDNKDVIPLIKDCLQLMSDAGLAYTTVDDYHFMLS